MRLSTSSQVAMRDPICGAFVVFRYTCRAGTVSCQSPRMSVRRSKLRAAARSQRIERVENPWAYCRFDLMFHALIGLNWTLNVLKDPLSASWQFLTGARRAVCGTRSVAVHPTRGKQASVSVPIHDAPSSLR